MDLKREPSGGLTRGRRASILVNVVLITALGGLLAFLFVHGVQRLSWRAPLRFDLTADQRYAIDPLARRLLEETEDELRVTFVAGFDRGILERVLDPSGRPREDLLAIYYQPIFRAVLTRVTAVLREWGKTSPRVQWKVIWQPENPAEVERLARAVGRQPEDILNRVVLTMGPRNREVPLARMIPDVNWGLFARLPSERDAPPRAPRTFRVHEELTAGLQSLLEGQALRVGLVTEVGGPYEPGREERAGFITGLFQTAGFELVALPASRLDRVPEELAAVLVLAPQTDLPQTAIAALVAYEAREAGRLILVPSPRSTEPFTRLLEPYGVRLEEGIVTDSRLSNPMRGAPHSLDSDRLYRGAHPIVAGLTQSGIRSFLGWCRPMRLLEERAPGAERTVLLSADLESRILPIEVDPTTTGYRVAEDRFARPAREAPVLGLALERPSGLAAKPARIAVFSGQGLVQAEELLVASVFANRDLLLNALRWVTDRESTIGIVPRDQVRERLVDPNAVLGPATLLGIILLPGLAAILGALITWSRRS